jgi:outer membrane protein TolC
MNLYRGSRDQNLEKIIQTTKVKLSIENDNILRLTKVKAFKLISEIQAIENDNIFLDDEIKENEIQMKMAKKKVDAGLTTSADLLDFQIKTENLSNEISNNNFKISDLEKELLLLVGNKLTLEQIKNEFKLTQITPNETIDIQTLPEFNILKSELSNAKLETINVRSEYYPSIDLEGKYGSITPANKLFGNKTEYQISLNLNIPIFSGGSTNAKFSKAVLESSQKERELRQLEIELRKKIVQEKKKLDLNKNIMSSLDLSLKKASKYKELTIFEYKKGIKNSSDVINASDRKLEINRKINELKKESEILTFSFNTNYQPTLE